MVPRPNSTFECPPGRCNPALRAGKDSEPAPRFKPGPRATIKLECPPGRRSPATRSGFSSPAPDRRNPGTETGFAFPAILCPRPRTGIGCLEIWMEGFALASAIWDIAAADIDGPAAPEATVSTTLVAV